MTIKNNQTNTIRILLVLLVSLLLIGCSSDGSDDTETPSETDTNKVTDIVWQWETLKVTTGFDNEAQRPIQETTTIPDPENYTLLLQEDGSFSGQADCNQISGTYSTDGGYTFSLGPATLAACGDDSFDQQYLQLLDSVVAGGPDGAGGFALETAGGSERMEFSNGGAAPAN